jgi:GMP reductase
MRIEQDTKIDFDDVLIRPKRSTLRSRKDVLIERTFKFLHSNREWSGIPIIAANMDTTGTFEMVRALSKSKVITALHKFYSVEELADFFKEFDEPDYVAYTLGIRDEDFDKFKKVLEAGLSDKFNFVCLDVPNAYLERFVEKLKELRALCPKHTIMAGNVVTNEMSEELLLAGADIVKIGIGSGSACITRKQTGVGYPQLSAVIECSDAAHGISNENGGCGLIISDGGAITPSCVGKAYCGGADFVMLGSLFAGFDQSGGEIVEENGIKYKEYYGMSSDTAMNKHYGGIAKHRTSEGRSLKIPYKGDVNDFIQEILGSLRSTGTYIGARKLKEFSRRTTFIMVNRQLNKSLERYDLSSK